MTNPTILLASKSPRRRNLIDGLGFPYRIVEIDVEEIIPEGMSANEVAEYLARLKSGIDIDLAENEILLTADTIVVLNNKVIGKPTDLDNAKQILTSLSGQEHQVMTGVCLRSKDKLVSFLEIANIQFYTLTDNEIEHYINNYEVLDKAGSYAIHEWIGKIGIKKIEGDFYSVMGLPIAKIYQTMKSF